MKIILLLVISLYILGCKQSPKTPYQALVDYCELTHDDIGIYYSNFNGKVSKVDWYYWNDSIKDWKINHSYNYQLDNVLLSSTVYINGSPRKYSSVKIDSDTLLQYYSDSHEGIGFHYKKSRLEGITESDSDGKDSSTVILDSLGRPSAIIGQYQTTILKYDDTGRLISRSYVDTLGADPSVAYKWEYNDLGQIISSSLDNGGIVGTYSYVYDNTGVLVKRYYRNSFDDKVDSIETSYETDEQGNWIQLQYEGKDTTYRFKRIITYKK